MNSLALFSHLLDAIDPNYPRVADFDAWEDENKLYVRLSLPGFEKSSINVTVQDSILSVDASKVDKTERKYLVRSSASKYLNSIQLPDGLDEDGAEASYENGILTVELKKKPDEKPKRIEVRSAT